MDATDADIAAAPLSTNRTRRARQSFPLQIGCVLAINLKMFKVNRKERR